MTLGIVIPTYHAEKHLHRCLEPIVNSKLNPQVLIVDSSSSDNTVRIALEYGVTVKVIDKKQFNHGSTREWARKQLKTDIVVMMTQDAYLTNNESLSLLIEPIIKGKAAFAYGRQIPHEGAGFLESFHREFNYPTDSQIRTIHDKERYGPYLYFCSNSFAAYNQQALDTVEGFPHVIIGEDTVVAAKLLQKGYSIAYVAEATVHHSHKHALKEEFKRYYDIGKMHQEQQCFKGISTRGNQYVVELSKRLLKKPFLFPYAFGLLATRWLGYKIGKSAY